MKILYRKHWHPNLFITAFLLLSIIALPCLQERLVLAASTEELSTEGSDGLDYSLYTEEATGVIGYGVTGIGTCEDIDIVVPQARISFFGERSRAADIS